MYIFISANLIFRDNIASLYFTDTPKMQERRKIVLTEDELKYGRPCCCNKKYSNNEQTEKGTFIIPIHKCRIFTSRYSILMMYSIVLLGTNIQCGKGDPAKIRYLNFHYIHHNNVHRYSLLNRNKIQYRIQQQQTVQ